MINSKYNAIGIVEISFYTNAVILLDEMLKASEVTLVQCEKLLGGRLVSIIVGGETSAVQSAIETALEMGSRVGKNTIKIAVAIPSPHPQIMKLFNNGRKNQPVQEDKAPKDSAASKDDSAIKDSATAKKNTALRKATAQKDNKTQQAQEKQISANKEAQQKPNTRRKRI